MTAVMRILGWRTEGLRCPDHEIDCSDGDTVPRRVSLIQMPNGTGKTTTLTLLRAALSGSAASWDPAAISELQKKGAKDSHGVFELRLLLNGRRVTIIMDFDFDIGRVRYKTTRGPGQVHGFDPPVEFRRFMNEKFVSFFVFDGELAEHLLDRRQVHAEAVVERLFQIDLFHTLTSKVTEYWERSTRNVSATEDRGLTRRQNRVHTLRDRLAALQSRRQELEEQRSVITTQLRQHQMIYDQEIGKEQVRSGRLNEAGSLVAQRSAKVREDALDVLDRMREPQALSPVFASMMHDLKSGLDRVKLPEGAAREFFEELAVEAECVCGRPIDAQIGDVIRKRAGQYLGSDEVSLLNSMKTAIQEAVGQSRDEPASALRRKIDDLAEAVDEERLATNALDELRLEAEQADPAVREAKEEIEGLEVQLADINRELEMFSSRDDELGDERTFGIGVIERRLRDAENKLAEISSTMQLKNRRDILTKLIEQAHKYAREGITAEICADANRRVLELMPYNKIVIDRIDRCLVLRGQEGGSVGETLSVAYAFLATLFHRSEHSLPFVVDSPANPIDLAMRPRIGELIPKLTKQFIAFTISSERKGFVPRLTQAGNGGEVQFITLFRKESVGLEWMAQPSLDRSESEDGVVVRGQSFFNSFQLDEEV